MYKLAKPLILISNTPSHVGSGSDLGVVDLPIQRERHTMFPKYEASGLKGSLKQAFNRLVEKNTFTTVGPVNQTNVDAVFGKDDSSDYASAIGFSDARILLFPIKSVKNVFAWITCPMILNQFKNELHLCGQEVSCEVPEGLRGSIPVESELQITAGIVALEEYSVTVKPKKECTEWANWFSEKLFPNRDEFNYWKNKIKKDLVIVPDDVFADFVTLSTDVITRIRIDHDKGVVKDGHLFTEEYLPAESILYSLVVCSPILHANHELSEEGTASEAQVLKFFTEKLPPVIQIGGNQTLGKGITHTHVVG